MARLEHVNEAPGGGDDDLHAVLQVADLVRVCVRVCVCVLVCVCACVFL